MTEANGISVEFNGDGEIEWVVNDMSIVEDATPLDPADTTGGVGQISFTIPDRAARRNVRRLPVVVEHHGTSTAGTVISSSGDDVLLKVTANGAMFPFNVIKVIPPFVGTLSAMWDMLAALCGVTVDADVDMADINVIVPGGEMNVLDRVKELCQAWQVEVSMVDGVPTLRYPRSESIDLDIWQHGPVARTVDDGDLAQTVQVSYFNNASITDGLVYPLGGWTEDVQVYALDAGETEEFEIPLNASLSSIKQPQCVASVDVDYVGPDSVYCIASGTDGILISPAQWADGGGKVRARISDDTRSIIVTVTASADLRYSPYSLRMPSGETEGYSSLRIVGTGVSFDEVTFALPAATEEDVSNEVGASVRNECVQTWAQAFEVIQPTVQRYAGPKRGISFNVDPHAGVRPGMRVKWQNIFYRIRSVTDDRATSKVSADIDTIMSDFEEVWAGLTTEEWDTFWGADGTIHDVVGDPLLAPGVTGP